MSRTMMTPGDQLNLAVKAEAELAVAKDAGRHLWVATAAFRVLDPTSEAIPLGVSFLFVPPMVGCFVCEREFSPELAAIRCPGEPS